MVWWWRTRGGGLCGGSRRNFWARQHPPLSLRYACTTTVLNPGHVAAAAASPILRKAPAAPFPSKGVFFSSTRHEKEDAIAARRLALRREATFMTQSLYRCCLRCIRLLRRGNERDEAEFRQRLQEAPSSSSPFSPPVDRENELQSRANYYLDWSKENFHQESDLLDDAWWTRDTVERYVYFLQRGEEQRKWLLQDYGFKDPYPGRWKPQVLEKWETEALALADEMIAIRYPRIVPSHKVEGRPDDAPGGLGLVWGEDEET